MLKVVFRADASINIGAGHVMRCLTLADNLTEKGAHCTFICREHTGNLSKYIRSQGHTVHDLPIGAGSDADLAHSAWLGATQTWDAQVCALILDELRPDWLVVDHYALDFRWEREQSKYCGKVVVIDDLADRPHYCHVLLDQTFDRSADRYRSLVPADCTVLCGSKYALLRPEFAALRPYSLQRRVQPKLNNLLITMGGVDNANVTARVMSSLRASTLPADCKITVILGPTAPWLSDIQQKAQSMPWSTTVLIGVDNMAQLMADSDLAIGAAGSTSWERCCVGLPTIIVVSAENQVAVAAALAGAGAARVVELNDGSMAQVAGVISELCESGADLIRMSQAASRIVDGQGLGVVLKILGA
jgi:UDP-2,4-diacetamido-2,4,6-trideoxy-beta-L-altropyranose hydrolase